MKRSTTAFLVAPLAVPLIMAARLYPAEPYEWSGFVTAVFFSALIAYGGTFALGAPAYRWLRNRKLTALWIAPLVGFVAAGLAYYAFFIVLALPSGHNLFDFLSSLLSEASGWRTVLRTAGPMGALVGCLFWLIARPDRPA